MPYVIYMKHTPIWINIYYIFDKFIKIPPIDYSVRGAQLDAL